MGVNANVAAVLAGIKLEASPSETTYQEISAEAVFYDGAMRRLDEQVKRADTLDGKTMTALAVGSTILPVTLGFLNSRGLDPPLASVVFQILAVAWYLVLLVFSWRAYRFGGLDYRPALETLEKNALELAGASLHHWVARECLIAIAANEPILRRKALLSGRAITALHVEASLLSVAAVVTLL